MSDGDFLGSAKLSLTGKSYAPVKNAGVVKGGQRLSGRSPGGELRPDSRQQRRLGRRNRSRPGRRRPGRGGALRRTGRA